MDLNTAVMSVAASNSEELQIIAEHFGSFTQNLGRVGT